MGALSINVILDGRRLSVEEIRAVELERARKTLAEMLELGATPMHGSVAIEPQDIGGFDLATLKQILVQTKVKLGLDGIKALYKQPLLEGDRMWHEIAAASPEGREFQPCIVDVEVDGLTIGQFMAMFMGMMKPGSDLSAFFDMHPEHFVMEAKGLHGSTVMEVMGMYGPPAYMWMDILRRKNMPASIPIDKDTNIVMAGIGKLVSDGSPMKLIGAHQFKIRPNGMSVKLAVYFPKATPKELVEGHKWHFAVEFFNAMTSAHQIKSRVMAPLLNLLFKFVKI
ncbi:MAG: hypothetical protein QM769_07100 [Pseudoxanthomonas sp.]